MAAKRVRKGEACARDAAIGAALGQVREAVVGVKAELAEMRRDYEARLVKCDQVLASSGRVLEALRR